MTTSDSPFAVHPQSQPLGISRRYFLQSLAATSLFLRSKLGSSQNPAAPNSDHGRIKPPVPLPDVPLLRYDGVTTTLPALTLGHATAIQMMFTTCTTTCPIQAAIFQRVQTLLPDMAGKKIQLLSLSINPEDDNTASLSHWRDRFNAGPQWIAAAPSVKDTARIQTFFGQSKGNFADHSTQVNIVDRQGCLVWRTNELPTSQEIAAILRNV